MDIMKEMPSRFVNGDEIAGKEVPVTIRDIKKEKALSPTTKKEGIVIVVYFVGSDRGVRLGKERARELVTAIGSKETDDWKDKKVIMYTQKKEAFGAERNIIHFKAAS